MRSATPCACWSLSARAAPASIVWSTRGTLTTGARRSPPQREAGGLTVEDNLALACFHCNRHKGTDLGSVSVRTQTLVRFYNPRTDRWKEHFCWSEARIEPLTDIGEVTARLLESNHPERVAFRKLLAEAARYPTVKALALLRG